MELGGAYQTLVGVLLSARTRDEQVLKLLPAFFKRFPNVYTLAEAEVEEITGYVNTIGMYRQKAKHLNGMARRIVEVYGGEIPRTMEDLVSLPGVGRKTASVILPHIYGIPAIAVDTHAHRVANRLGWVKTKTPAQTEKKLLELVDEQDRYTVNQVMVKFGRYICIPGKPRCSICPIADVCPYKSKNLKKTAKDTAVLEDIERRERELQELRSRVQ